MRLPHGLGCVSGLCFDQPCYCCVECMCPRMVKPARSSAFPLTAGAACQHCSPGLLWCYRPCPAPGCAGEEREGVAVQAFYSSGDSHIPLSWEQLYTASAAELDARLELQPDVVASSATEVAGAADIVLPLGLPPSAPALAAAAGDKLSGSSGSEAAAALAADRLAFTGRIAELGFTSAPMTRLQLSELADADVAQQLSDLAAYVRLDAWAKEHLPTGAAPRLALRAEVSWLVVAGQSRTL